MNEKFIVGRYYRLRDDYPTENYNGKEICDITFNGRMTTWCNDKIKLFDGNPRKVIRICENKNPNKYAVEFEGVDSGTWNYHVEDFIEVAGPVISGLNTEFKVGQYYKIRDDYPEILNKQIIFENRKTDWVFDNKAEVKDRKYRKVLSTEKAISYGFVVKFDGIDGTYNYHPEDFVEQGETTIAINTQQGVINMELKTIKKANMAEAKKQFEADKANEEIRFAKSEITRATNEIDRLDREIKSRELLKKPYLEILENFK